MRTFICKQCGEMTRVPEGVSIANCDYCGVESTFSKTRDERIAGYFNRAEELRGAHEYDKAVETYEQIVREDGTDAEARWGLVLSKYGIEYVEEKNTGKRVPTFHRLSQTSILADADYNKALEYADSHAGGIYEAEANRINEIQKKILTIASTADKYDVFICFKKTEKDGKTLTKDCLRARDIYHELTRLGYRVFFSEITLDNKSVMDYEAYIYVALQSAKVMLAIGTCKEHFESEWVKNEWSRYLIRMKDNPTLLLIPCYEDMDAYDIPAELRHIQARDMAKLGFVQIMTDEIKRVLDIGKAGGQTQGVSKQELLDELKSELSLGTAGATVESKTEYAFRLLEMENFSAAKAELEEVLRMDSTFAPAYAGMYLATVQIPRLDAQMGFVMMEDKYIQLAMQHATPEYRSELERYDEIAREAKIEHLYEEWLPQVHELIAESRQTMSSLSVLDIQAKEKQLIEFAEDYESLLGDYKDSLSYAQQCRELGQELKRRREAIAYEAAERLRKRGFFRILSPILAAVSVILAAITTTPFWLLMIIPWFIMYKRHGLILRIILAVIFIPTSIGMLDGGILGFLSLLMFVAASAITFFYPAD